MGAIAKVSTILLVAGLVLLSVAPSVLSDTTSAPVSVYSAQYSVLGRDLFVSIQPSLYAYYSNLTHALRQDSGYNRFVTPKTVQPIADVLLNLTTNLPNPEEQFANAVLDFVHQVPYNITGAMYPIETLVNNRGDCGAVSLLAASIMKAGGLDIVLLRYSGDPGHMNVGVYLPYTPTYHSFLAPTASFQYDNKTYWAAEATPKGNWRVGDQTVASPDAQPIIIPLNSTEQSSPGQVSCGFTAFSLPSITLNVLPHPQDDKTNRSLVLSGSITPAIAGNEISIYINKGNAGTNYVGVVANDTGSFSYVWNFTSDGTYYVSASVSGGGGYAGVDSDNLIVLIGPESLMQFQGSANNYMVARSLPQGFAVRPYLGLTDFLSVPLGSNISLSYSFLVLPTGHSPGIQTKSETIPATHYMTRDRSGQARRVEIPARNIVVPAAIPAGQEVLVLPGDFNQTVNSKFCFFFERDSLGDYALNARALDGYDASDLADNSFNGTSFLNVTQNIEENALYTVNTDLSEEGIATKIQDESGVAIHDSSAQNQLVLLVADNVDSAVVLRDFQVKTGIINPAPVEPAPSNINTLMHVKFPLSFVIGVIVIAIALTAAMIVIGFKKRKVHGS